LTPSCILNIPVSGHSGSSLRIVLPQKRDAVNSNGAEGGGTLEPCAVNVIAPLINIMQRFRNLSDFPRFFL